MKKLLGAILFASLLLTISCSHDTEESSGSSYDQAGKKHFLVLTNTSSADIPFDNIPSAKNGRSAVSERTVIAEPVPMQTDIQIIDANLDEAYLLEKLKTAERNPQTNRSIINNYTTLAVEPQIGDTKTFWCLDGSNSLTDNTKNQYTFELKAIQPKCLIWVSRGSANHPEPSIENSNFTTLAYNLNQVFDHEMGIFGSNVQTLYSNDLITADANTKVNVLIYDICGDGEPSQGTAIVGGLFSNADMFRQTSRSLIISENPYNAIKSNECECIHADSYLLNRDVTNNTKFITSTLLHEFQHMLHFINKTVRNGNSQSDTWYNEMLSMCAEDIFQTQLGLRDADSPKNRLSIFNAAYYDGFKNWRSGNDVLKSYANAYAFGAYLMRNYGGVNLIHQIASNPQINESSITDALKACGFDETFNSVLLKFSEAIVYPTDSSKHTLNKSWNQNFNGTNYSLTAINLLDYANLIADSSLQYIYDSENRKFTTSDGRTAIKGPVILNEGAYYQGGNLGAYGTHGIYLGIKNYKPSYANTDGVTQTLLYMD